MSDVKKTLWRLLAAALASLAVGCSDATIDAAVADAAERECCADEEIASTTPLPDTSVWQMTSRWTDQHGDARRLGDLRGQITVTAMIFTNCVYACPTLLADVKAIRADLPPGAARYLLVSMDAERDQPDVLDAWAEQHDLDDQWTLLHGSAHAVRELAAVLGVNYTRSPTGDIAHSNLITVLDRDGRIVHQQRGLQAENGATVRAIRELIDG